MNLINKIRLYLVEKLIGDWQIVFNVDIIEGRLELHSNTLSKIKNVYIENND